MKKTKNIELYDYQDDTMPCCVNDSCIDGEISDELKQLIDERLAKIENGTMEFITMDVFRQNFERRKQASLIRQREIEQANV